MPITAENNAKTLSISPCRKCGNAPEIWSMNCPDIQWIGCARCDISHRWGSYYLQEMILRWEIVNSADENIVNYLVSEPEEMMFFEDRESAMQYIQSAGEEGRRLIAIDKYGVGIDQANKEEQCQ